MNLEEIKSFIDENKEQEDVKVFLQGYQSQPSVEELQKFALEHEEGKKWFDSQRDKHFSKGLETWKTNNLESIIAEELKKRNPDKTPEQLEIEKLKAQFAELENAKTRETLKNKALTVATEKKLPTNILDFFIGQDEDSTVSNLTAFEEAMQAYVTAQVEERLKGSYTPPSGGDGDKGITKEKFQKMTYQEKNKLYQENPELYKQLKN
ncbi:DUF4355 domain-containing protein [Priestia megaterium]|uniref:DUF4355 domain-containing protein n=1 Tax=Priestia megaterium TaxID=1404 RepID=UPI003CC5DF54